MSNDPRTSSNQSAQAKRGNQHPSALPYSSLATMPGPSTLQLMPTDTVISRRNLNSLPQHSSYNTLQSHPALQREIHRQRGDLAVHQGPVGYPESFQRTMSGAGTGGYGDASSSSSSAIPSHTLTGPSLARSVEGRLQQASIPNKLPPSTTASKSYRDHVLQGSPHDAPPRLSSTLLQPYLPSVQDHFTPLPTDPVAAFNPVQPSLLVSAALGSAPPDSPSSLAFSSPALSSSYWPHSPGRLSTNLSDGDSPVWSPEYISDSEAHAWPAGYASQDGEAGYHGKDPDEAMSSSFNPASTHAPADVNQAAVARGGSGKQEGKKKKSTTMTKYHFHQCSICFKVFPRPSGLATHMNTHTGARPFKCQVPDCNKRFAVRSNATRHLRTHGLSGDQGLSISFDKPVVLHNTNHAVSIPTSYEFVPQDGFGAFTSGHVHGA